MLIVTVAIFFSHCRNSIFLSCSCCVLCLHSALVGFSHVHIHSFWVLLSPNSCKLILDRAEFFSLLIHKFVNKRFLRNADKWTRSFGWCNVTNIADNKNPCTFTLSKQRNFITQCILSVSLQVSLYRLGRGHSFMYLQEEYYLIAYCLLFFLSFNLTKYW